MATKGQRWKVRGYLYFSYYSALLTAPTTAVEFAERSGALLATARQALVRWRKEGLLHDAGKVRQQRGPPAARYCANPRIALLAHIAWLFEEQERKTR